MRKVKELEHMLQKMEKKDQAIGTQMVCTMSNKNLEENSAKEEMTAGKALQEMGEMKLGVTKF